MNDALVGELVVFLRVVVPPTMFAGDPRIKRVALARIACTREESSEKLAEFWKLNPQLHKELRVHLSAKWTGVDYVFC